MRRAAMSTARVSTSQPTGPRHGELLPTFNSGQPGAQAYRRKQAGGSGPCGQTPRTPPQQALDRNGQAGGDIKVAAGRHPNTSAVSSRGPPDKGGEQSRTLQGAARHRPQVITRSDGTQEGSAWFSTTLMVMLWGRTCRGQAS